MAVRRRRRSRGSSRRTSWRAATLAGSGVLVITLALFWAVIWPYLLGAVLAGGVGTTGWWLWRTDRRARSQDRSWREADRIAAGRRALAEVDVMTGTQFEELVAELCRRDGCTEVRRVGGAGDNGVDVVGRLPDGRAVVIQCKRYAPTSTIASRELRDLLGAKVHFGADLAIFVTTTRFSRPSQTFAVKHGILAIHRDHLGLWNSGAQLDSLISVNGSGQGDAAHRVRWKSTYGR